MFDKKLTLAITGTALAFGSLGLLATPAGAHHQHYILTPQGNQITLPCEPDAVPHHPRHTQLHLGPSKDERAITVDKYDPAEVNCENPLPNGPVRDEPLPDGPV